MPTIIANPPIGIYNNTDLHLGHLFYHTVLDVVARYEKTKNKK